MMNREVLSRQLFAEGGAAFPDLSGDGKVTKKDILIGRGVTPMQNGGMAPMPMAAAPGSQMTPPGLPPIDPNSVDINQAAQAAMQQGIDPAVMEGMLMQYSSGLEDLENAEDYETVMNGIRGDDKPIESRYQELASVVGPEDAQQTPESVLALVQPVMMMAAIDQGIGGLAAEQMNVPVEGAIAEGIMSTVNMGGPDQAQGGPAPVNFNKGGSVAYMRNGGDNRLGQLYRDKQALYRNALGMADQEAELADQIDMTKAQMLFDVAQGALMFATPEERNMSPAERLAKAFTPVLGNISTRAGELQKFKNAQNQEKRALNLKALGAAEKQLATNATKVGSTAKTDELTYLTNPERMTRYATGALGDEKALYEQALLDYTSAKDVWDPALGKYVEGSSGKLSPSVLESVQQGNPELFKQITGTALTSEGQLVPETEVNLMTATSEIMNPDGTVNNDSPVWESTPPYLFDPNVDYREVIGASRILPGIGKMFSEGAAELFGGDASPRAKSIAKASTSLDNLANDILQYNTSDTDNGRILKFVQELIERETQGIRPGGFFLKTDADAEAAMDSIASTLQQQLQLGASVLPEYGGTPGNYTEKQITTARKDMQKLKVLYNEVLAFQEGFGFKPTVRSVKTANDQSTSTARNQILEMLKQNTRGQ